MSIKFKWHWLNIIFILNHMFQLGSADSNGDQIKTNDENLNLKLSMLKQMANNLKPQLNNTRMESGIFYRPNSNNHKLNEIFNRIKYIEQNITALSDKDGDVVNIKVRMNIFENEIENIRKSIDNIFRENMSYQNKIEESLLNVTSHYNDMAERLAFLEEPRHLKELEDQLMKGDYLQAKVKADLIRNDDIIIDVMKKVYELKRDNDTFQCVDGYLYFAGIVNNLSRRLLIYQYIYEIIKSTALYQNNKGSNWSGDTVGKFCFPLKLIHKLLHTVMKMVPKTAGIYDSAIIFFSSIRAYYFTPDGLRSFLSQTFPNDETMLHFNMYFFPKNYREYISMERKYITETINETKIDCCFEDRILLNDRDSIMSVMMSRYNKQIYIDSIRAVCNSFNLELIGKIFVVSLSKQNYNTARSVYNTLRLNNNQTVNAFKELYNKFHDVDSILTFADLVGKDDRVMVSRTLYDVINKADIVNICDMLKVHDSLVKLNNLNDDNKLLIIINDLERAITLVIKNDMLSSTASLPYAKLEIDNIGFFEINFNSLMAYSKRDGTNIGELKYYLIEDNLEKNHCYFHSKISLDNYNNWYWKYIKNPDARKWYELYYVLAKYNHLYKFDEHIIDI